MIITEAPFADRFDSEITMEKLLNLQSREDLHDKLGIMLEAAVEIYDDNGSETGEIFPGDKPVQVIDFDSRIDYEVYRNINCFVLGKEHGDWTINELIKWIDEENRSVIIDVPGDYLEGYYISSMCLHHEKLIITLHPNSMWKKFLKSHWGYTLR